MTKPKTNPSLAEFSPITEAVRLLFEWLRLLSPMLWCSHLNPLLESRNALTQSEVQSKILAKARSRAIEHYICCCLITEIILVVVACVYSWPTWGMILLAILPSLRILEIMQVTVNVTLFDALISHPDELAASHARLLILSGINFLELVICFGIIYAMNIPYLHGAESPWIAFYFSTITQLTIGYGDMYPMGWLRILVPVQALMNTLFVVLVFGRLMTSFPQIRGLFDKK
jgi:hypothetical protein